MRRFNQKTYGVAALAGGGYTVFRTEYGDREDIAAFTTLDEAIAFLRACMLKQEADA